MTGHSPYDEDADCVLAAEYALGLLAPDEAGDFEARIAQEPHLRDFYAQWAEDLASLADTTPEAAPPASLKPRIDADLFGAPALVRRPFRGWGGIGWLVGAAMAAAVAMLVIVNGDIWNPPSDVPGYAVDIAADDGSLRLTASYDAQSGQLVVERQTGAAPAGRSLELWLIAGENAPISLGVLPGNTAARFDVAKDLRPQIAGGLLAVTDEPPGGSPTGAPTGTVLASGTLTAS